MPLSSTSPPLLACVLRPVQGFIPYSTWNGDKPTHPEWEFNAPGGLGGTGGRESVGWGELIGLLAFLLTNTFSEPASLKGIRERTLMAPDSCPGLIHPAPGTADYRSSSSHHQDLQDWAQKAHPCKRNSLPSPLTPRHGECIRVNIALNPDGSLPSLGGRRTRCPSLRK